MTELKHVVLGATDMGGCWYNLDFTRFAILPRDVGAVVEHQAGSNRAHSEAPDETLGDIVDDLVGEFGTSEDNEEKDEIIRTLIELHAQQRVLWPMTLLFGASALGDIGQGRAFRVITEAYPELVDMRGVFERAKGLPYSEFPDHRRKAGGFNVWKTVMACRFASTAPINATSDFKNHHVEAICEVVRPKGPWDARLPGWMRSGIVYTADTDEAGR